MRKNDDEENRSLQQLALIRKLITLASVYRDDKAVFYDKFVEAVNVRSLEEHGVVEIGEHVLDREEVILLKNAHAPGKQIELRCLQKQGFKAKEMSVILGLKHPDSIHVKLCRLRRRLKPGLKASMSLEMLIVLIIMCIILLLIMDFFF